jgi:hypothetical protein
VVKARAASEVELGGAGAKRVFTGLASKPVVTVSSGLASKPATTVFTGVT